MSNPDEGKCPVCSGAATSREERPGGRDGDFYDCPNCGRYFITGTALSSLDRRDTKALALLSHAIWMNQGDEKPFEVHSGHLKAARSESLPTPLEQLERFIVFLGNRQGNSPGKEVVGRPEDFRAKVGAISKQDVYFISTSASERGLMKATSNGEIVGGRLTLDGWERYRDLKQGRTNSRTAFMAMPFGNEAVKQIVDDVFRPAVEETGFRLKRVDDEPVAGSIVNRIRVEILTSRFVIADLTNSNNGAYWEAGYAEGLGKPVIYTCRESFFKDPGTHFDTKQALTVLWNPEKREKAAEELKATIRATLPFEARMPAE